MNEMDKVVQYLHIMAKRNVLLHTDTASIVVDLITKDERSKEYLNLLPVFSHKNKKQHDVVHVKPILASLRSL